MKGKWLAVLVTLPFLLFFFAFQIVPLIWILFNSFQLEEGGWGLANFSEILNSSFYLQAIRYSLEISLWSSLFGLIIALFGSYSLSAVRPSRIGDFILSFNSMTSNFSGIPLAFAFIILLGANGAVNLLLRNYQVDTIDIYSKLGIIIIYTYFQIPLAVLLLYPAFEALKKSGRKLRRYWAQIQRHIGAKLPFRY